MRVTGLQQRHVRTQTLPHRNHQEQILERRGAGWAYAVPAGRLLGLQGLVDYLLYRHEELFRGILLETSWFSVMGEEDSGAPAASE